MKYLLLNTIDNEYLAKTADPDGGWTCTDDLDEARTFDTVERAEWAKPEDDEDTTWVVRPFDLTVRLQSIVNGIDGYSDAPGHVPGLLATELANIEVCPFLLVERAGGDNRYWLTLHESPSDAGAYNYQQENGDWDVEEIIDVRDGSRWNLQATFKAVPA